MISIVFSVCYCIKTRDYLDSPWDIGGMVIFRHDINFAASLIGICL